MEQDLTGLGWVRPEPDERDWRVPRELTRAGAQRTYRYWPAGKIWDQGPRPHCVEYSGRTLAGCSPCRQSLSAPEGEIYNWCQRNDEWAGEAYDGTSVHALARWLKANGYITSYRWAKTIEELHAHLMLVGPAIIGSEWTMDMFMPDRWGFIRPTGRSVGGHAWCIRGGNSLRIDPYTRKLGVYTKRGTWGLGWGNKGEALIAKDDLASLIDSHTEILLAVEFLK